MAITMTREQYKQKYGSYPEVAQQISKLDTSVSLPKMTRAEYEAKYNVPVQKKTLFDRMTSGKIDTSIKQNAMGVVESWKNLPGKLYEDIQGAAKDIETGIAKGPKADGSGMTGAYDVTKGLLKGALRPAADIAETIFAPVTGAFNVAMDVTGAGKGMEYVAQKIVEASGISNNPTFQKFSVEHPNAEADLNRALVLLMSKGEKGKIEPARMIEEVRKLPSAIKNMPKVVEGNIVEPFKNILEQRRLENQAKVSEQIIANREKAIFDIENSYAKTRKAMDYSKDANASSRKRIASTDVLANSVSADGKISTKQKGGAIDLYKEQTIKGLESVVRDNLVREGVTANLSEVYRALKDSIMNSGLEGADLKAALKGIENEVRGLKVRANVFGDVLLEKIHDAKVNTTNNIDYMTPKETATYRKAVARAYKELIENKSSFDVKGINAELAKYYKDIELLENLDGKIVKGGKLGKYFAQISGNIIGGAAGGAIGGVPGTALGTVLGGEIATAIKGKTMESTFGKKAGLVAPENKILATAKERSMSPKDLSVPDKKVGAPANVVKTKEVLRVERQISDNVEAQKAAIKAKDFKLVAKLKELYAQLVETLKKLVGDTRGFQKLPGKSEAEINLQDARQALKEAKGLSASDIMKKHPDINLKRDISVTDIYGKKKTIPAGEALTPYELKGNKVLLQDGETYIVSKNQAQNVINNSVKEGAVDFAPELKGLEETVIGTKKTEDSVAMEKYGKKWKDLEVHERAVIREEMTKNKEITKYSKYTLPGGENYREILIKAPQKGIKKPMSYEEFLDATDMEGGGRFGYEEYLKDFKYGRETATYGQFKSSHWDELDVGGWIMAKERTIPGTNKKAFFVEETQDVISEGHHAKEATDFINKAFGGRDKFNELKAKRELIEAVNSDADYIAWANGEQISAKYNLATSVDNIDWGGSNLSNRKIIDIQPKGDRTSIRIEITPEGNIYKSDKSDWQGKKLDEVLGKGLTDKIMSKETGTLSGEGLKFGGEWADTLYGKPGTTKSKIGNIYEKLTGGKVEIINLSGGDAFVEQKILDLENAIAYDKKILKNKYDFIDRGHRSVKEVKDEIATKEKELERLRNMNQQAIRLTPEIKAKIQGKSLLKKKPSGKSPF